MAGKFQDIIPPEKKSIRNIPIPRKRKTVVENTPPEPETIGITQKEEEVVTNTPESSFVYSDDEKEYAPTPSINYTNKEDKKDPFPYLDKRNERKNIKLWIIAGALCITLLFIVSGFFAKATITISPKSIFVENFDVKANKAGDGLTYSTISTEETKDLTLKGNGEKEVNEKAKGTIIIYNNHGTAVQNLVVNTRFETPDGLIYRLEKAVTVPGQKKDASGKLVAGSIEAKVIADQAGPKYNIGLSDFTIPGLKGDPRFNNMYARSKTNMTGGMVGKVAIVSDEDLKIAKESIAEEMKEKLKEKIKAEIPVEFFLPENSFIISTTFSDPTPKAEGEAEIKATSKMTAYVFDKKLLLQNLSPDTTVDEGSEIVFTGGEISSESLNESGNSFKGSLINTQIKIVPKIDELKKKLLGLPKKEAESTVTKNQNIQSVKIVVSPVWSMKIPKKDSKVNIVIE